MEAGRFLDTATTHIPAALQWTYNWSSASTPAILHVEFTAKTPEAWLVNSWEWVSF